MDGVEYEIEMYGNGETCDGLEKYTDEEKEALHRRTMRNRKNFQAPQVITSSCVYYFLDALCAKYPLNGDPSRTNPKKRRHDPDAELADAVHDLYALCQKTLQANCECEYSSRYRELHFNRMRRFNLPDRILADGSVSYLDILRDLEKCSIDFTHKVL